MAPKRDSFDKPTASHRASRDPPHPSLLRNGAFPREGGRVAARRPVRGEHNARSTPPSALDIARALIAFPSVTPADAGALPYLRDLLVGAGFAAELVTFRAPGTPDVLNLYARFGSGAPNLAFAGHTDVVPPGDVSRWRFDPFSAPSPTASSGAAAPAT